MWIIPSNHPQYSAFAPAYLASSEDLKEQSDQSISWAYVEIETFIIANLIAGMEAGVVGCAPVWTDAKTFAPKPFHKKVHGIIGGYPCQPFSVAGKGEGVNDPRHLFPHLQRSIEAIRPVWCFFENVAEHLKVGFNTVYNSLHHLGYSVEAGIYSAAETGAPHNRERLFILAVENTTLQRMRGRHNDGRIWPGQHTDGLQHEYEWQPEKRTKEFYSSPQLANTNRATIGRKFRSVSGKGAADESQTQKRQWRGHEFENSSEGMANTGTEGLQRKQWGKSFYENGPATRGATTQRGITQWPANPGHPQHKWEHPRTIEPGMGSAINGYNFREDLLRALGNSVVEQTGHIAFIDLMHKHGLQHLLPTLSTFLV